MREYKKIKIETEGGREMKRLNLIILIILALIITVSLFACNSADKKTPKRWCMEEAEKEMFAENTELYNIEYIGYIVEDNKIENAKTIAEKFILDGYSEIVKLTTQIMKDTTGNGRIAFMIEAEGNTDSIHNLFIVEVKEDKAELIAQLF